MIDVEVLRDEYLGALPATGLSAIQIITETVPGPHAPPRLKRDHGAVYVFALTEVYGSKCSAGPDRVLKVGRAGPNSGPRFQYQHYQPRSARSNLARSLLKHRIVWRYLGIKQLDEDTVASWIQRNTDRYHLYIAASDYGLHGGPLEVHTRGLLGPVFEGSS